MWFKVARIILRNRIAILAIISVLTGLFGYFAFTNVKPDTKFANMLPPEVPERADHEFLKSHFSEDGNVLVIGVENVDLFELENFRAWYDLGRKLQTIPGIDSVFSVAHMFQLVADHDNKTFRLEPVTAVRPETQAEVDTIRKVVKEIPFYRDLLYKDSGNISLMMVALNAERFNSAERGTIIFDIQDTVNLFTENLGSVRYSGLPFIREVVAKKIQQEMGIFVGLALAITALILFLFFRSLRTVLACLLVVAIGVIWSLGTIGMMDFPLSILMSVIPPVIIVIGIPNCIFLLNKYHREYAAHGNKVLALTRIIQKIGNATFLTNLTTALGFATFMFTTSDKLQQFGLVASINIIVLFLVSLCVVPIIFSFLNPPSDKHIKHLENKWVGLTVDKLIGLVTRRRNAVYFTAIVLIGLSIFGMSRMVTTGNMASDLPHGDPVLEDLIHFEEHFGGVMPFEILIDTRKKGGATDKDFLLNLEKLQQVFPAYRLDGRRIFSRSLSVADAVKFANQALNFGDSAFYSLDMSTRDRLNLKKFIENSTEGTNVSNQFLDSNARITRVSVQVADIGSLEMELVVNKMKTILDTIMNPDRKQMDSLHVAYKNAGGNEGRDTALSAIYQADPKVRYSLEEMYIRGDTALARRFAEETDLIYSYHANNGFADSLKKLLDERIYTFRITGTSVVLAASTSYLVDNLVVSISIAILIISLIMALLFRSWKMVLVSLIPNFIPLLFTAGVMGIFGIPIKPSTMLVFSIAFGISVDDTIHYLAKYRQELMHGQWDIRGCALRALRESGMSMIYTSVVLFFGFIIFTFSSFGGTIALGLLVSLTLLVAMITNLVVLPSLLLSLHKAITTRSFKEPYFEIFNEDEDGVIETPTVKPQIPDTADSETPNTTV
jgi:hypothetical protein